MPPAPADRVAIVAAPAHHAELNALLGEFENKLRDIGFDVEHAIVRLFHKTHGPLVVQVSERPKPAPVPQMALTQDAPCCAAASEQQVAPEIIGSPAAPSEAPASA